MKISLREFVIFNPYFHFLQTMSSDDGMGFYAKIYFDKWIVLGWELGYNEKNREIVVRFFTLKVKYPDTEFNIRPDIFSGIRSGLFLLLVVMNKSYLMKPRSFWFLSHFVAHVIFFCHFYQPSLSPSTF